MKIKKGLNLFIMLAMLIAHTFILTVWLANGEAVHQQANFKNEEPRENLDRPAIIKVKFTNFKDSTEASSQAALNNFNTRLK